ncbi:acyltransferase [Catenibacterium mitsuokai]|uniref:Acyltransferase n=1 Tax=Catenibacterium mitsuokai TaxID=100886 RepID=A0AAW4MW32_9FIRM|nr:acyltransferase [Catenibacterium mitsuokai]MBV3366806.1 acyltransferase [Catenibacterium mitsuokai]MBV3370855.1 acyltransferase [Catenibacterium mitsuokai]MBV3376172.1 acyltransferase [Catenibacterium mitsuokai]MBV3380684.1 acyltransferase [Catenibacterium mitsuokai]MBV3382958.1 acyltransferase [Catenibacterium mitsuokai]
MKTKRIEYIDLANVISTFAVVILHTNGCFWNFSRERYWLTANVIESLFIFAVPVFFMISSISLMDYQKKYDTKIYLKKRFSKTVIPFLFWTFMGLLFDIFFLHTVKVSDLTLKVLVDGFINNRFVQIYWFFMPLFGIYLSIPLFASIEEEKRVELFKYLFLIGFIFNGTIPFLLSAFHIDMAWPLGINVVSGYAIFVVMGYLIHKMDFTLNQRCIIYILGLAGLLMHFGGTYYESYALGDVSQIYKNLTYAPIVMYSGAFLLFIKQIGGKVMKTNISKYVHFIKKYTFPIYLMHYYIIEILNRYLHLTNYTKSIFYRLGMPFIVIPITIIIAALIRKLRLGKKILP